MNVTEVKLYPTKKAGSMVKAFGKATIDDKIVLDVIVMDKGDGNGAWATFPNGKTGTDGKYYLPVFFKDKEDDTSFKSKVIEAYNTQIGSGGGAAQTQTATATGAPSEDLPF